MPSVDAARVTRAVTLQMMHQATKPMPGTINHAPSMECARLNRAQVFMACSEFSVCIGTGLLLPLLVLITYSQGMTITPLSKHMGVRQHTGADIATDTLHPTY